MAKKLNEEIVPEDETVTQMVSMLGKDRNKFVELKKESGRSLSAEILYWARQGLKAEEKRAKAI